MALEIYKHLEPYGLLGKGLVVELKAGGRFYFKCTEAGFDYMRGFDDEGLNIHIFIGDIYQVEEVA